MEKSKAEKTSQNSTVKKRNPGGGRKLKYGEPVAREDFKCPISKRKEFRQAVNAILKTYIKK